MPVIRCGPMDVALRVMHEHAEVRRLLGRMTSGKFHISQALEAMEHAKAKGVLKVQLTCS